MTADRSDPGLGPLAEAAEWRVRLSEAGVASTPAFEAWLAADPTHAAAWTQAQRAWSRLDAAAALPEVSWGREQRLRDAEALRRRAAGVSRRRFAIAASLGVTAGGFGGWAWFAARPEVYETTVGERRSVTLADGSVVLLDSASRVEVKYADDRRDLWLRRGQARFEVAKDKSRPFRVEAGDRIVVATGTAFDVELLASQVQVTLLEGRVSVYSTLSDPAGGGAGGSGRELSPGDRLIAPANPTASQAPYPRVEVVRVATADAGAWASGALVFDGEPLPAVLERMNRYSERRLVAADAGARSLRISGTFKAGDVDTFLDALTAYFPVKTTSSISEVRISSVS